MIARANLRESTLYRGAYLVVSLAVLFLDQWTKGIVTRTMEVHQSRPLVPDFFDLTYVRNSGRPSACSPRWTPRSRRSS